MIDENDIDRLREIFVTRKECDSVNNEIKTVLANVNTELALIKQKQDSAGWIAKTTLAAVIVAIVGAILALILR